MTTPTEPPGADTPRPLQPRKIYKNTHTGRFGWQCRVCPHEPSRGGYADPSEAHQRWQDDHVPTAAHQRYQRNADRKAATDG